MSVPCPSDVNLQLNLALMSWLFCIVEWLFDLSIVQFTFFIVLDSIHNFAQLVFKYFVLKMNQCMSEGVVVFRQQV